MVKGFEVFREHFRGFEDCYTIIGGTACDILMSEAALDFRATKDIDMILLMEDRFPEFAATFWAFIKEGGYKCGWKSSDVPHFYRFTQPKDRTYPAVIELFSRRPDFQEEHMDVHLTPLPVSDEISSLSAIMLDEDYYQLMLAGRRTIDGVSVLNPEYLMLFKARAYLDLRQKKQAGTHVDEKDIRKHKNDVFRLFAIADPALRITLSEKVSADMNTFLDAVGSDPVSLYDLGLGRISLKTVLDSIRAIFQLTKNE